MRVQATCLDGITLAICRGTRPALTLTILTLARAPPDGWALASLARRRRDLQLALPPPLFNVSACARICKRPAA
eukprot:1518367-Rhodomonas_salina.2